MDVKDMTTEDLYSQMRSFSAYHAVLMAIVSNIAMTCGQTLAYNIFGQYTPNSHCKIDLQTNTTDSFNDVSLDMNRDNLENATFNELQNLIMMPKDISMPNQENCKINENYSKMMNQSECIEYTFDDSIMTETIVTRYNLNCDKSFIPSLLTSLLFVGYCFGAFAGGTISDRFGRKRAFTIFLLGYVISTFALLFIDSIIAYQSMRLLQVFFAIGGMGPMITYVYEICGSEYQAAVTILQSGVPWSIGYSVVAFIAQTTRDWWQTMLYSSIIIAPWPIIFFFFVPESFRYFISKGDMDAASKCLKRFPMKNITSSEDAITSSDLTEFTTDFPALSIVIRSSFENMIPSSIIEFTSQDTTQNATEDTTQNTTQNATQNTTQDTIQDTTQNTTQDISQDTTHDTIQDTPKSNHIDLSPSTADYPPGGMVEIQTNGPMIFHFTILVVVWIVTATLFNGLFFYVGVLPGTPFSNTYYTTLIDSAAYIFTFAVIKRLNRRTLLLASFIKTTLFCTLGAIFASNESLTEYTRWCALIGKFGICVIYSMIYLIAAELFPTPIRSKAVSFGMAICTVGGFISPLVIEAEKLGAFMPFLIFSVIAFMGVLGSIFLPETSKLTTLDSMEDGRKFHYYKFLKLRKSISSRRSSLTQFFKKSE